MSTASDEQLVALYLEGQEYALKSLIEKYLTPIYNFVGQFVGYGVEAEDVTQETFIKLWKNIKKFKSDKKLKPWLYRIAKNTAVDHLRQRKITMPLDTFADETENQDNFFVDTQPLPMEQIISAEKKKMVQDIINNLPSLYATVLRLYYLEEFSLPEVAEILSEPISTIKSKHRRALQKIRLLLDKNPGLLL